MPVPRFRYLRSSYKLAVQGHLVPQDDADDWFAPLDLVGPASLASLAKAIEEHTPHWATMTGHQGSWDLPSTTARLRASETPIDEFDEDYSLPGPMELALDATGLVMDVIVELHGTGLDESDVPPLVEPLLNRAKAALVAVASEGSGTQVYANIRVRLPRRGATVYDAWNVSKAITELLARVKDGDLTAESAFDLLKAGRADLLVGLPEANWLEAKSRSYDLQDDRGRIELAQDVARFANGNSAGLLIIGLTTKKRGGVDIISSILPQPNRLDSTRYHRALDQKVFPPIDGLIVEAVPAATPGTPSGFLLAILVPAQPEEAKPVLVHGAIVGSKVEGAFISIVQRRGEHSVAIRPEALHATLAAGRALLRRGEIPSDHGNSASPDDATFEHHT